MVSMQLQSTACVGRLGVLHRQRMRNRLLVTCKRASGSSENPKLTMASPAVGWAGHSDRYFSGNEAPGVSCGQGP